MRIHDNMSQSLQPNSTEYTMLVVSDLDDVFLPKPTDLLLNLTESRAGIEALLEKIPEMFSESHALGSALGPGLQAAYKMTVRCGSSRPQFETLRSLKSL